MKKSKLVIEYDFDFDLIGVASPAKSYKLAWDLNQALKVHLIKQPDLIVGFRGNDEKGFAHYNYQTQLNRLKMFKNRPTEADTGKYFLVPEFPHFDFIILASMEDHYKDQLIPMIKSIESIQLVSNIPLEGLKSKSNFIF